MKKTIYILLLVLTGSITAQNREFTVNGRLPDSSKDGWTVRLRNIAGLNQPDTGVGDAATVVGNKFILKDSIDGEAEIWLIDLLNTDGDAVVSDLFVVEPGNVNLTLDSVAKVTGSVLADEHQAFRNKQESLSQKIVEIKNNANTLYAANSITDDDLERMEAEMQSVSNEFVQIASDYIQKNIKNGLGEFYFMYFASILPPDTLQDLYDEARPAFQKSESVNLLMSAYGGVIADDFKPIPYKDVQLSDLFGNTVKLSDYVGKDKVVFVDFWASWCGPCRKDMPSVVALYEKFKDKDFEIVGISLDENQNSWASAVQAMRMDWIQMSDLKGWKSAAADIYSISSIPQSFLIDKQGNIVAHNLKGRALNKKIEQLLSQNTVNKK